MATRTITGNLAADPEVVQAGNVSITKFRVVENTGDFRGGKFVEHDTPTTHFVEAKFELGANAAESLHKGDEVTVTGPEHTESWGDGDAKQYGRVIEADQIGVSLRRATVTITKNPRDEK